MESYYDATETVVNARLQSRMEGLTMLLWGSEKALGRLAPFQDLCSGVAEVRSDPSDGNGWSELLYRMIATIRFGLILSPRARRPQDLWNPSGSLSNHKASTEISASSPD